MEELTSTSILPTELLAALDRLKRLSQLRVSGTFTVHDCTGTVQTCAIFLLYNYTYCPKPNFSSLQPMALPVGVV